MTRAETGNYCFFLALAGNMFIGSNNSFSQSYLVSSAAGLTSGGKEYIIPFMANPPNDKAVELLLTTASSTPAHVRITTPPSSTPAINLTVTVKKGETEIVTLPADIRSTATGINLRDGRRSLWRTCHNACFHHKACRGIFLFRYFVPMAKSP